MYEAIKSLYEEDGKSRKLFIAGHSLGGALATVAAARLAFVDNMSISGMYTIGSPRYCMPSVGLTGPRVSTQFLHSPRPFPIVTVRALEAMSLPSMVFHSA